MGEISYYLLELLLGLKEVIQIQSLGTVTSKEHLVSVLFIIFFMVDLFAIVLEVY